jgi:hypothetical protein
MMVSNASAAPGDVHDDTITVCAIAMIGAILADVLHEGLGHAALAFLTGAQSGTLSTVAWSSAFDSRLVAAGGTLVNIATGLAMWLALRVATRASSRTRYFLLVCGAFNLFAGTGYFFFSGVTDFGDWAAVIQGMQPHWVWRAVLTVFGIAAYYGAVLLVGRGLRKYVGIGVDEGHRLRKLMYLPYFAALVLLGVAGLLNPIGIRLVFESALPASAGANSGLLWLVYYIPRDLRPERTGEAIARSHTWIAVAAAIALAFIFILGPGISLHR